MEIAGMIGVEQKNKSYNHPVLEKNKQKHLPDSTFLDLFFSGDSLLSTMIHHHFSAPY